MLDLDIIRKRIEADGCFNAAENRRIRDKFFSSIPPTFRIPLEKYSLHKRSVLDVGCGYGPYLAHFGPGSRGLDINARMVAFARSIGLDAVEGDAECGILPPGPYDAVWCSNLLEHVTSPHNMLRAFYNNLKPGGLLFLKIPLIPHPVFGWIYSRLVGVPGYAAEEHLYAYSRSTAAFIVERAGFVVLEANCFWPSIRPISDAISPLLSRIGTTITVVGRRLDSFAYAEKRP